MYGKSNPFPLTMAELLPKVKKFVKQGRLGFQRGKKDCTYYYDDKGFCRCVIGAGLPSQKEFENRPSGSIGTVVDDRIVVIPQEELWDMKKLQGKHDYVCCAFDSQEKEERKKEFYKFLHEMYRKYLKPQETGGIKE